MTMIRKAIKEALAAQKISQRRCAIYNEIDYTSFNKFINNQRPLPLPDIEKVFDYLGLEITPTILECIEGKLNKFIFFTKNKEDVLILVKANECGLLNISIRENETYSNVRIDTKMDFATLLQFMDKSGVSDETINPLLSLESSEE